MSAPDKAAKMPTRYLKQVKIKKHGDFRGYIKQSAVVVDRNGATYLIIGKKVHHKSSKSSPLYIQGYVGGDFVLCIPKSYKGKWSSVDMEEIGSLKVVPVTKIEIGGPFDVVVVEPTYQPYISDINRSFGHHAIN